VAFRAHGGVPQYAVWAVTNPELIAEEEEGARSGNALPILQLGKTSPPSAAFAVRLGDPHVEVELYWRSENGRVRHLYMDDGSAGSRVIRAGSYWIYTMPKGGAADPSSGLGDVTLVTRLDGRVGWVKLDKAAFARCLCGKAVIEPGALRATREVTLRLPAASGIREVWLESVEVPFLVGDRVNSDGTVTIPLPDMPGEWRVFLDRAKVAESLRIDPQKRTDWVLDPER
jgi:hypothetical protein